MIGNFRYQYVTRIVVETATGLSVTSGQSDPRFDSMLVRDANGLPTIPGTALAGVLQHLFIGSKGEDKHSAKKVFGKTAEDFKDGDSSEGEHAKDEWDASRLHVSFAVMHDSQNQPVEGLLLGEDTARLNDPLLRLARQDQPVERDHVALSHRGIVSGRKKFTRVSLPKGFRFTFELALGSDEKKDPVWQRLLDLLQSDGYRIGGATRRGLGKLDVLSIKAKCFDTQQPEGVEAFLALPVELAVMPEGLETVPISEGQTDCWAELSLEVEDFIRFGQGHRSLDEAADQPADLLPLTQISVSWKDDRAEIVDNSQVLIPASAIKGAIAHRLDFHCRRLSKDFASEEKIPVTNGKHQDPRDHASKLVKDFLGYAVRREKDNEADGGAGHLVIDDQLEAAQEVRTLTHNSIDRFSQGVCQGALYGEEMLYELPFKVRLAILKPDEVKNDTLQRAFRATLHDLLNGRLALGAGQSNGHGFVTGQITKPEILDPDWFGGR